VKLGPYAVTLEGVPSLVLGALDSFRVNLQGIPRLPGDTPAEVAAEVVRRNAGKVLIAGSGHFWFMWVSDFGKALRGVQKVLPAPYLRGLIELMIVESVRKGRVTSCFNAWHGFDMPYARGDNLPWLIDAVAEHQRWTGDRTLMDAHRSGLQGLLDDYERTHFVDGLLDPAITGDWVDTILRPSSTYNNLCALHMVRAARALGLKTRTDPGALEGRILGDRFRGDHLTDFSATEDWGVDAAVVALYLGLFDEGTRRALADGLESRRAELMEPCPIRASTKVYDPGLMPPLTRFSPHYHSSVWLHLGLMHLNGLKRLGRNVSADKARLDAVIMRYRNVIEAVDREGRPYRTLFHSCEHGLTMAAGQVLELALA